MRTLSKNFGVFAGKNILVRCNFDVPLEMTEEGGKVLDTTRIEGCGETLRVLLEHGSRIVLIAHLGRPNGVDESKSLKPIIPVLEDMLGETVAFLDKMEDGLLEEVPARIVLMENLRFWGGETDNDAGFVDKLSKFGEMYVNEAFANCHREHASIVGLARKMDSVAGLQLEREIKVLSKVREKPEKPLMVVIGGAKLETKEPLVEAFKDKADYILVGGKIAEDLKEKKVELPDNVYLADQKDGGNDIDEKSATFMASKISEAGTVIWNGTMGVFEDIDCRVGTKIVAESVNKTKAFTVVGGGDTETALTLLDLEDNINHICSGGGAMLKYLIEGNLPGIKVLGYGS